jgi:tripartite-type tricarboxylate transporter receptor subunit TctC
MESRMLRSVIVPALALAASLGFVADAAAQSYPQRTVKFILPFGPASGTDITARLVADRLAARWGKAAVIENRPGGDGLVEINAFIAANDDHTLLWVPVGTFAVHPYEKDKLPYEAERDLLPVSNVTSLFLAVTTSNGLNVGSLRELVDLLRGNPDKFNWAAANGNADFLMSGFLKSNGLQVAKTPYRDILQAPNDLAENRIQLLSSSLAIVTPLMQAGKVKVLAVTGRKRAPSAPGIPTVREAGFPALEMESIGGIFGPRGMPLAVREQIAADVQAAVSSDPSIAAKLQATGQVVDVRGPAEFAAGIKELREQLAGIAKVLGMKAAQ